MSHNTSIYPDNRLEETAFLFTGRADVTAKAPVTVQSGMFIPSQPRCAQDQTFVRCKVDRGAGFVSWSAHSKKRVVPQAKGLDHVERQIYCGTNRTKDGVTHRHAECIGARRLAADDANDRGQHANLTSQRQRAQRRGVVRLGEVVAALCVGQDRKVWQLRFEQKQLTRLATPFKSVEQDNRVITLHQLLHEMYATYAALKHHDPNWQPNIGLESLCCAHAETIVALKHVSDASNENSQ